MRRSSPPAYAWDWFSRQRLLWREVHRELARPTRSTSARYRQVEQRSDVVALLRADYSRSQEVRTVVDAWVRDLVFLGLTNRQFAQLGVATPPRGLRWWWTQLTGEELDGSRGMPDSPPTASAEQLAIDNLLTGYGD